MERERLASALVRAAGGLLGGCAGVSCFGDVIQPDPGQAAFTPLGPPQVATSAAYGLSRDGSAIIGSVTGGPLGSAHRACLWRSDGTFIDLGIPAGFTECYGLAVANGGSVAVLFAINPGGVDRAFLWRPGSGAAPLIPLPPSVSSVARAITGDGRFVVGDIAFGDIRTAILWSAPGSVLSLGDLPGDEFLSYGIGLSADGNTVVGMGTDWTTIGKACRWRRADPAGNFLGPEQLPGFPGGPWWAYNIARAVTPDGKIAVGEATHAPGVVEACLWTAKDEILELGNLRRGDETYARSLSERALVVVGESFTPAESTAFLWTPQSGMRSLKDELQTRYGLDLSGWELEIAFGVSDDGRRIAGSGFHHGVREAWAATLPAPCYPDCNDDGVLNTADLSCFQARYLAGAFYADCTGDGETSVADIACFQSEFSSGCP